TTLLVEHHVRTERHGLSLLDLLLAKSRVVEAEIQVEILKVALAGLIAHRTVERVIGQQELQDCAPAFLCLGVPRVHDHAFRRGRVARDLELRELFHVDETDAAVACDREAGVVAISRNKDPQLLRGLDDRGPIGHDHIAAIDAQLGHDTASIRPALRPERICASNSPRNLEIYDWIGQAAASAKTQMVFPSMPPAMASRSSRSRSRPCPSTILRMMRYTQPVPSRQGEHWPQDSCAKKRTAE